MRSLVRFQLAPHRGLPSRVLRPGRSQPGRRLLPAVAARHPHRRRRHRRRRCAVRRARHRIDGEVLDLMSSWVSHFARRAAAPHRARDERRRARRATRRRTAPVVHDLNADPGPAVPRRLVRRRGVLRVGRLPGAADRGVRRRGAGGASRRPVRVHVLEPVLPDQGDPGLAVRRPTPSTARSWPSTSGGREGWTSR